MWTQSGLSFPKATAEAHAIEMQALSLMMEMQIMRNHGAAWLLLGLSLKYSLCSAWGRDRDPVNQKRNWKNAFPPSKMAELGNSNALAKPGSLNWWQGY